MSKNLLQDVIKIKRITRKPIKEEEIEEIKVAYKEPKKGGFKYRLWILAFISTGVLLFALSFLFSQAKIIINPKIQNLPLNQNISAVKDSTADNLSFDLVAISGDESKNIEGSKEKNVSEKAKGTILFYNAFSYTPQVLAVDSRIEGSNGKIYKIAKKISIPGMTKGGTPGKFEVGVYASLAGESYNSAPLDFKVLGFKGTAKYSKIYARSESSITGGIKGVFHQVSDTDKIFAVNDLKNILKAKLLKKVTEQIPEGFILFKDAVFLDINNDDVKSFSKDTLIPVSVKGTLYGFLFDEKKLTKNIAQAIVDKYDGSDVYVQNIKDLKFSLLDQESTSFKDVKNIDFNLSGTPKIVWKIDENKFINDILGKSKKDFDTILSSYVSIDSASLSISPFWKNYFPEKAQSIKVTINYPQ